MSETTITVATANIAGAMRAGRAHPHKHELLASALMQHVPDIIGFQEVIRVVDGTCPGSCTVVRDDLEDIREKLPEPGKWIPFFFRHLDSYMHPHPGKWWKAEIFRNYFSGGQRILQGAGILIKSPPLSVLNLWDGKSGSSPRGSPVGRIMPTPNTIYCGNRDTEPRSLLMARVKADDKVVLFCSTQLSTLKEEDGEHEGEKVRVPTPAAAARRAEQVRWIVDYLRSYQTELGEEGPVVLAGDFNCEPGAEELQPLGGLGLRRVQHRCSSGRSPHTHRGRRNSEGKKILIDHIFVSPHFWSEEGATIIDLQPIEANSAVGGAISDHHPVVAKLVL